MKNEIKRGFRIAWLGISPWFIMGALVILVPLFVFMTLDNIKKQREHTIEVLLEKGDTLIRSFEAGVRTGIMGRGFDFFQLQRLLLEMARQPDIDYITVTSPQGAILADSDPSLIGESYGTELDLDRLSHSSKIQWRFVPNQGGIDTLEILRRFSPAVPFDEQFHGGLESDRERINGEAGPEQREGQVIFVGLNIGPLEVSRKDASRHTILMAVVLLFIGAFGIVSLFFAQGYRSARVSLSRIKAFSDNIVDNMPIGLIALDGTGNVISFNQTAESILQFDSGQIVGKKGAMILPHPFQEIIDAMALEKGIVDREIDYHPAGGKTIHMEIIATMLKEENGNFLGHVLLFKDLTELQYLKKEIARSQRLASLGNLAAGIAHEIRNPLSSIKGFATYFKERYRDNPQDGETADIMIKEVERLNRVITQLLEFARPMTMDKKPLSLQTLIRQTLKMIEGQAREKNIAIHADLVPEPGEVSGDEDKIRQVLLNLYLNALESMTKGGVLTVSLRGSDGDAMITVSDTGAGIDQQHLSHVFDPYFTTKPSGTGLGLSIVHKIIEAHNGEIGITSATGKGATFSILLPVTEKGGNL